MAAHTRMPREMHNAKQCVILARRSNRAYLCTKPVTSSVPGYLVRVCLQYTMPCTPQTRILRNAACAYLQVAGFRFWKTPGMGAREGDKAVPTEKAFQGSVPKIAGEWLGPFCKGNGETLPNATWET